MSGSERTSRRVASVEDADESDNPIEGTGRYAESVASPVKERPNTGRARKEKARRDSSSPLASGLTDSDSTVHPREKSARDSREFSSPHKKALAISKQTLAMRPAAKHANTTPHLSYRSSDEASYYGVPTTVTPASSRPRARTTQRPASYYGNAPRPPPPSNAQFYARQGPSPAAVPTSYPPQSWAQAGPMVYPMAPVAAPPPPRDYFSAAPQHLLARFGARPQSAMGHRPSPNPLAYEEYDVEEERHIVRRPSRKSKDRMQMPPPPRPQSARPTMAFRPPPSTPRKIVGARFADDELDPDRDLFHVSPLTQYDYPPPLPVPRARRPSFGAPSTSYDTGLYRTEVASTSRRNSYLGNRHSVSSISDYEDKMRQAQAYQEDVSGGPTVPLTAETLRRASKHGATSSRSTRSSGSHDESDYRQSATTRTTRSSNNNEEDVTIRIKGVRSVEVGGAKMHCDDGAEININSRASPGYRGGSDRSSYIDHEDRRHRIDRPPTRTRSGSQAGSSFTRAPRYETAPMPRYDSARYDQYGYPLPPYTSYPPPPPPGYI
ncbi:hypothetical protein CONLIGDRAFT_336724 [Coniochaeta ligniaria NRRL 30616]|uniref:Uncharacterized protein n=1 Tax=Coniochaeta ligniaria NRRL 30616 TaxID=1408157 RepID=A0A1J7IR20_9PEZI|nr:hypothetical protein CONLIGDRAFT_336724 [Coniochaeta ligniaria NRRL 30616]